MEEAFLLFLKNGFKAVRISDIEQATQISRGTFYYHFSGKEEVLKEGICTYYALLNSQRIEEFERISTLREYIDLTIRKVMSVDHYTPTVFNSINCTITSFTFTFSFCFLSNTLPVIFLSVFSQASYHPQP